MNTFISFTKIVYLVIVIGTSISLTKTDGNTNTVVDKPTTALQEVWEKIKKYYGVTDCVDKRKSDLEKCLNIPKEIFGFKTLKDDTSINEILKKLKLNETQCNDLPGFRTCVVDNFKQCNQSMAKDFDNLFELSYSFTGCKPTQANNPSITDNHSKEANKSTASGIGGIHNLVSCLLIFIYGIYMYV